MFRLLLFTLLSVSTASAQWTVQLTPRAIPGMPGLQSFVAAEYDGLWVFIGGRTDGLHQRQPPRSFLAADRNTDIWVVDPIASTVHKASVQGLPPDLADQLSSTNIGFEHVGRTLVLIGGYGFSATAGDHITFPAVILVDLPRLVHDVRNGTLTQAPFRRHVDERCAVTGGGLGIMDGVFVLAGGHRFDGRYNPMGGASFTQTYTDEIRMFRLDTVGGTLALDAYRTFRNAVDLHRRDYNFVPTVFANGTHGYTMFSGVFQIPDDLPYLTLVDVDDTGYAVREGARQYLSHYHSAVLALVDSTDRSMHTVFFGGMSQYDVDATGTLLRNDSVPFVRTISVMTRMDDGTTRERKLDVTMPDLLGAGAEFLIHSGIPTTSHGVILLHRIAGDTIRLGTIVGGIRSTRPNIFWINDGTQSDAQSTLYDVHLIRTPTTNVRDVVVRATPPLTAQLAGQSPTHVTVKFTLPEKTAIDVLIHSVDGRILAHHRRGPFDAGTYDVRLDVNEFGGQLLFVSIHAGGDVVTLPIDHRR